MRVPVVHPVTVATGHPVILTAQPRPLMGTQARPWLYLNLSSQPRHLKEEVKHISVKCAIRWVNINNHCHGYKHWRYRIYYDTFNTFNVILSHVIGENILAKFGVFTYKNQYSCIDQCSSSFNQFEICFDLVI